MKTYTVDIVLKFRYTIQAEGEDQAIEEARDCAYKEVAETPAGDFYFNTESVEEIVEKVID